MHGSKQFAHSHECIFMFFTNYCEASYQKHPCASSDGPSAFPSPATGTRSLPTPGSEGGKLALTGWEAERGLQSPLKAGSFHAPAPVSEDAAHTPAPPLVRSASSGACLSVWPSSASAVSEISQHCSLCRPRGSSPRWLPTAHQTLDLRMYTCASVYTSAHV